MTIFSLLSLLFFHLVIIIIMFAHIGTLTFGYYSFIRLAEKSILLGLAWTISKSLKKKKMIKTSLSVTIKTRNLSHTTSDDKYSDLPLKPNWLQYSVVEAHIARFVFRIKQRKLSDITITISWPDKVLFNFGVRNSNVSL